MVSSGVRPDREGTSRDRAAEMEDAMEYVGTRPIALAARERPDSERTVLLVEDDPVLSQLVGEVLEEAGYRPVSLADHDRIGAAVERWRPRCVILDGAVLAPGQQRCWGDAVAIRLAHPELPVLMFTADAKALAEARAGTSARSRAAGFVGVVGKPFLVEEFLATVRSAVDPPHPAASPAPLDGRSVAMTLPPDISVGSTTDPARADLFNIVGHELRTPLAAMSGWIQVARRSIGRDPVREREALERALVQVARMDRQIGQLLDRSRSDPDPLSLEVVAFDLCGVVADVIADYEHGETARIAFERARPDVCVRGDPHRIAQIIGNLLDNALKYSPDGSRIALSLTVFGTETQLRVEDRGLGVAANERDRIFEPYYRSTRTRALAGTGLGLHIGRCLAERHGGRLWLERSTEAGSVFALALPLAG